MYEITWKRQRMTQMEIEDKKIGAKFEMMMQKCHLE